MSSEGLLKKLEEISFRYDEVSKLIVDPEIISDMKRYVKLNREFKELEPIVQTYLSYKNVLSNIDSSKEILKTELDDEFREMAKLELDDLFQKKEKMDQDIKRLLIPKDPDDNKDVIIVLTHLYAN